MRQANDTISRHGINILAQYLQTDPEVGTSCLKSTSSAARARARDLARFRRYGSTAADRAADAAGDRGEFSNPQVSRGAL